MRRTAAFVPCLLAAACATGAPDLPAAPTPAPAPAPPRDSDLRSEFTQLGLLPRAQGPRPTCSIFTTVAVLEFAASRASGATQRLSVDYCNWAANAANGRADDGDFFHFALSGYERFGICRDELLPYGAKFDAAATPPAEALVDGGRHLAALRPQLRVRWIRPSDGKPGLSDAQFADVVSTLANGWPVAAGSGHSRVLVGYRADTTPAGGTFVTLDSALGGFGEVPAAFVRNELYDVFTVESG